MRLKSLSNKQWESCFAVSVVAVVILVYNLIFFNRYFPVTEGWFSTYAYYILHGKIPYRDFYLFLTPLYPIQLAAFMALFGYKFIALRILGIFVILTIAAFLYLILRRFFNPLVACIATITGVIYYQSGVAHITYDFMQFMTAYALIAAYLTVKYCADCEKQLSPSHHSNKYAYIFLAGLFGALALLTKQSNGSVIVAFNLLGLFVCSLKISFRHTLKSIWMYVLGFLTPTVLILSWLAYENALSQFYQQAIIGASQAKGGFATVFFAWIPNAFNVYYFAHNKYFFYCFLLFGYGIAYFIKTKHHKNFLNSSNNLSYQIIIYLIVCFIFMDCVLSPLLAPSTLAHILMIGRDFSFVKYLIDIAITTSILLFSIFMVKYFFSRNTASHHIIISLFSFGFIYGTGMSAGLSETAAFLGLSIFVGYMLSLPCFFNIGKLVVLYLCFSLVNFYAIQKYEQPYAWWYFAVPNIKAATETTNLKLFDGFYLPPKTINIFKTTTDIILKNTKPGDSVLAFPNIPVFYLLSNRWPNIPAVVEWPDFLPDNLAIHIAKMIAESPPKVIVNLELPEIVWKTHEILFRHGKPCGQRAILAVIKKLTLHDKLYRLAATIPVSPKATLQVWVRIKN